ncbi:MAG: class I SAM-dependent methyltransferase [Acidimicrobiales bacterium]
MSAMQRWRAALAAWAIPEEILERSKGQSPWELNPQLFTAARSDTPTPPGLATRRALEALPDGGSVLDIGCGGGAASLALAPPAARLVGIDESSGMLDRFATSARERGVTHSTVLGRWPDVSDAVERADVVVCHHVVYNVPDLGDFALALGHSARRRVVIELTPRHPQTRNGTVWRHFWGLDRPDGPTANDAHAVLLEAGIDATLEHDTQINAQRAPQSPRAQAEQVARMCCLGPERVDEVAAFLVEHPPERTPPDVIWWDVA